MSKIDSITIKAPGFGGGETIQPVPALTVKNAISFPYTLTSLMVDQPEIAEMLKRISGDDRLLAVFPGMPDARLLDELPVKIDLPIADFRDTRICRIGTMTRIIKMLNFPDGTVRLLVRGLRRVTFRKPFSNKNETPDLALVDDLAEARDESVETAAMLKSTVAQFQEVISFSSGVPDEFRLAISTLNDPGRVVDMMADTLPIIYSEKLALLALPGVRERLELLMALLNREIEVSRLSSQIQNQVHEAMSRSQREFYLREQLKTIKKELGEETANADIVAIRERLKEVSLPEDVLNIVNKELDRMEMMPQVSPEYHVAYNYVDWLTSMPWGIYSEDRLNVKEAGEILERDHYGLEDVKERILEFLSVLQLKEDRKAPILCFVGPPGVGKTSLGQSIAESMGRKFVRISLGGVRDEAEIRGHRRTYIGALPGRIIQGLKKAGTSNPVFMLDEIDKLCSDVRGDPASALLEVLDPAQNKTFSDHFLEVDYDLSSVMFIATANVGEMIPGPLRDRMEVIHLPGYTGFEKRQIARNFLVSRQIRENGLANMKLNITLNAIDEMINHYTREAGVRSLERTIGSLCRKVARKVIREELPPGSVIRLGSAEVEEMLGPRKFLMDKAAANPSPGTATGMAWTGAGGTILMIEATMLPGGKGVLKLTGSLGNVMKESAETAFSYVRSVCETYGIEPEVFDRNDFHIHVPDGATPKDGPSAGIALVTALVSLLTDRAPRPLLSMTGEITLRGRVTAVGGIKEKVIAALRSGIKAVVMPEENRKDLMDIPENVKEKLEFIFVEQADKALEQIIGSARKPGKKAVKSKTEKKA
jgi:ATP-dependent Lon protease